MLQFILALLVGLSVLCSTGGCASRKAVPQKSARPVSPQKFISPELIRQGNLEILWQTKLPMTKEGLKRLFIFGNRIYALSGRNYIVCLDRENGNVVFSKPFVPAGFPVIGLELYKDELLAIVGHNLMEMNPETGTERSTTTLDFGIACPAVRNSSYYYIAGNDRRIRALRGSDKIRVFEVTADNDSAITSIIADEDIVIFATDAGNVVGITPDRPKRLWQFDASDSIVRPIVRNANSLFIASKDSYVYKLDALNGTFIWKHQTAAILDVAPLVTQQVVYQYVRDKGLTAIDEQSGRGMWQLPGGVDLLAEANGRAYVITNAGTLVVMDNSKAKQLYTVNLAGVSKYAANTMDSKIYIADESGQIACLKPLE